jgi:hypothetical protein
MGDRRVFWSGYWRERGHLEDPGIDGRIILRRILRKWDVGGIIWISLTQDRDKWWVFVNAVMNFGFHKIRGIS